MKDNFIICIESLHVDDTGDKENVYIFLLFKNIAIVQTTYLFIK